MIKKLSWKITDKSRLLSFLKERMKNEYSSIDISRMIRNQRCLVNKNVERFESTLLFPDDEVLLFPKKFSQIQCESERVLLDSPYYLIYDKPAYIASEKLAKILNVHLVHRLDRDTTGCILFAKTKQAGIKLSALFKKQMISKQYLAYVSKIPSRKKGTVKSFLHVKTRREGALIMTSSPFSKQGKLAITHWEYLKTTTFGALLQCSPITGRTHQIRVHLQQQGLSIIGDREYPSPNSRKYFAFRYLLHASLLSFMCPFTQEKLTIASTMPSEPIYYFSKNQKVLFLSC